MFFAIVFMNLFGRKNKNGWRLVRKKAKRVTEKLSFRTNSFRRLASVLGCWLKKRGWSVWWGNWMIPGVIGRRCGGRFFRCSGSFRECLDRAGVMRAGWGSR